tara:strand:- start:300 stop:1001 length:702 start_codon:yes stop_codon:yes gene_type:complete
MNEENKIIENTEAEATGATEVQEQKIDQAEKVFKQEDVDRIIANRLKQVERKYEDVDVEEYRSLKSKAEQAKEKDMIKKEQFEQLLQKQKAEADAKMSEMQKKLETVHIDGALLSAASKHKAVNPDHVANLLKNSVRLNETGQVEVLDSKGQQRYNTDTAEPTTVEEAVAEFINANAYLRAAQPAGGGSQGNATHTTSREVKLSDLDMKNPEHRKIYQDKFAVGQTRKFTSSN